MAKNTTKIKSIYLKWCQQFLNHCVNLNWTFYIRYLTRLILLFYIWPWQHGSTLPDRKHEQNQRVVITIFTANADNSTIQHGGSRYGGLLRCFIIIGPPVSHSPTNFDGTNAVILVGLSAKSISITRAWTFVFPF